jgi:lipopolysaccharide biosynthesis glycosyltransferase
VKKNKAVVFGLTSNHTFAVACVMMDIKRLSAGLSDEVVVIHDGISEKDQRILRSILPTRFIQYDFPLKSSRVLYARSVLQFTKMVFTKFECLRLLDDYENIMWMDYDIVIKDDISELFSPCDTGIKMMPGGLLVRGQLHETVGEYDMNAEGVSAGLFVFQENLKNYAELHRFCYEKLEKYVEILYMPEQAIFDFMIQEFELSPVPIDGRVYSPHPSDQKNAAHAKIIHAYGQPKFWNGLHNDQWNENYSTWLKLGGSQYERPTIIDKWLGRAKNLRRRLNLNLNGMGISR